MSSKLSVDERIANYEQKLKELRKEKQRQMKAKAEKKQREALIEKAKRYDFIESYFINNSDSQNWHKFVDRYKDATGIEVEPLGDSQPKPRKVTEVVQTDEQSRIRSIDDILESVSSND